MKNTLSYLLYILCYFGISTHIHYFWGGWGLSYWLSMILVLPGAFFMMIGIREVITTKELP